MKQGTIQACSMILECLDIKVFPFTLLGINELSPLSLVLAFNPLKLLKTGRQLILQNICLFVSNSPDRSILMSFDNSPKLLGSFLIAFCERFRYCSDLNM